MAWISGRHLATADSITYDGEELPEECEKFPMLAGGGAPSWYDGHGDLSMTSR